MRSTCWKLKSHASLEDFVSVSWVRPSHKVLAKNQALRILRVTFLSFTHTIYTLITHKSVRGHLERKTLDRFSTTHTPFFQRENYSSLVRNRSSLFSFPLPLSYLERRIVPKYNPHLFSECRECFGAWKALGIFQKKPVRLGGCNWLYCGIRKVRKDMALRSPLVAGA